MEYVTTVTYFCLRCRRQCLVRDMIVIEDQLGTNYYCEECGKKKLAE